MKNKSTNQVRTLALTVAILSIIVVVSPIAIISSQLKFSLITTIINFTLMIALTAITIVLLVKSKKYSEFFNKYCTMVLIGIIIATISSVIKFTVYMFFQETAFDLLYYDSEKPGVWETILIYMASLAEIAILPSLIVTSIGAFQIAGKTNNIVEIPLENNNDHNDKGTSTN
ncbi:hypothetical protein NPA09_00985 [Mycoplasmopsis equigenitalium]|uniref:Uncharacterized protein n=1 Tax=Mycoplasmopsis equigenitalium TaxID=114883 RepID=A0ABY5J594_9BACT|nr:hypothetical protein [Mycoplasmopsis equigenitalium]UUD37135.1 hypothetical protein NPA09_00985 [Mycoplasmopsis equigenitalium]